MSPLPVVHDLQSTSRRESGVLLHVTSLPGKFGIGDLGPAAGRWVDLLAAAGQRWWQILPTGPTTGAGHAPYASPSALAGNPLLVSPELMREDGLLTRADLDAAALPTGPVHYRRAAQAKGQLLAKGWHCFRHGGAGKRLAGAFDAFCRRQAGWLDDYALFAALCEAHGSSDWTQWPVAIARRRPVALAEARRALREAIDFHRFAQFLFFRQYATMRARARAAGVGIIGDLPIFVSGRSVDVWTYPELFDLDRDLRPRAVAGVPPDAFSANGQRWGNPLYNWRRMEQSGFQWWVDRARASLELVDVVRVDHFRGFEAYWRVPADSPTAKAGRWRKAPGEKLFRTLQETFGRCLPFIAEDLGMITPAVDALRDAFGLPGMRVLQFGFDGESDNPHLPHNYVRRCVAYTGTHDNDTAAGWYKSISRAERRRVRDYLGTSDGPPADVVWALIRQAWASVAALAVVPAQDLLALPSSARMNVPGRNDGNWRWRLDDFAAIGRPLARLGGISGTYGRGN